MAKLTYQARKKLSASSFAFDHKYPIPDIAHARNALARVATYGTASEKAKVYAAVRKSYPALWARHMAREHKPKSEVERITRG